MINGSSDSRYKNEGKHETYTINNSSATTTTITNTGSIPVFVPYISITAVGEAGITDQAAHCTNN